MEEMRYGEILGSLQSVADKVFIRPYDSDQIRLLESLLGKPLPHSYKSLLGHIGLIQDLFEGVFAASLPDLIFHPRYRQS